MLNRLAIAWIVLCAFLAGIAVTRIVDSDRVTKVVSEYNDAAARLRHRLIELEKP